MGFKTQLGRASAGLFPLSFSECCSLISDDAAPDGDMRRCRFQAFAQRADRPHHYDLECRRRLPVSRMGMFRSQICEPVLSGVAGDEISLFGRAIDGCDEPIGQEDRQGDGGVSGSGADIKDRCGRGPVCVEPPRKGQRVGIVLYGCFLRGGDAG